MSMKMMDIRKIGPNGS